MACFWRWAFSLASRIAFSYGSRDAWATMAIAQANLSATLPVLTIQGGSHCSDMELSVPLLDSPAMLAARRTLSAIITGWVRDVHQERRAARRTDAGALGVVSRESSGKK